MENSATSETFLPAFTTRLQQSQRWLYRFEYSGATVPLHPQHSGAMAPLNPQHSGAMVPLHPQCSGAMVPLNPQDSGARFPSTLALRREVPSTLSTRSRKKPPFGIHLTKKEDQPKRLHPGTKHTLGDQVRFTYTKRLSTKKNGVLETIQDTNLTYSEKRTPDVLGTSRVGSTFFSFSVVFWTAVDVQRPSWRLHRRILFSPT